jgi:hypothetical protein
MRQKSRRSRDCAGGERKFNPQDVSYFNSVILSEA